MKKIYVLDGWDFLKVIVTFYHESSSGVLMMRCGKYNGCVEGFTLTSFSGDVYAYLVAIEGSLNWSFRLELVPQSTAVVGR